MKAISIFIFSLLFTGISFAQTGAFGYQAVVRDAAGSIIANQAVAFQISIISGSAAGIVEYTESHSVITNEMGLVNLGIGSGVLVSGDFSNIIWSDTLFVKIEVDPSGGTTYTDMGTFQLLKVPSAFYAEKAGNGFSGDYNDLTNIPDFSGWDNNVSDDFDGDYSNLSNTPDLSGYATKDMGGQNITNLADPVNPQDAATKAYVDVLLDMILDLQAEAGVTDIDGNEYTTVKIGNQIWMAENLKVLKLNDGSDIPVITDNTAWISATDSAYCYYDNSTTYHDVYGPLYNWYAVNTGELCPYGWHVPTVADWEILIAFAGGAGVAGGKLKETGTIHWASPNDFATDDYGFAALPGGYRNSTPVFTGLLYTGMYWTATEYSAGAAWVYTLNTSLASISSNYFSKVTGASVRCIKD